MSDECIFCRIVAGDLPSRTIFEDDDVMAFLDANPLARGHTVVVPREHHERLNDLPEELAAHLFGVLHRLTPEVEAAVDADGSNVAFNDGEAAGQEIPHVHGHIIPRFENDGGHAIHAIAGSRPALSDAELDEIAERISTGSRT